MPDPTPKTRNRRPLTIGTALDKLMALEREKQIAHVDLLLAANKKHLEKRDAILQRLSVEDANKVVEAVNVMLSGDDDDDIRAGSIGAFGVDPEDSARLLELRQIIDEIGWPSFAAEEAADYPARLRALQIQRLVLVETWHEAQRSGVTTTTGLGAILDEIAAEVHEPHPDPLPEDGARAVKPAEIPELEVDQEEPELPRGARDYTPGPIAAQTTAQRRPR
jgi:hypothetical protein